MNRLRVLCIVLIGCSGVAATLPYAVRAAPAHAEAAATKAAAGGTWIFPKTTNTDPDPPVHTSIGVLTTPSDAVGFGNKIALNGVFLHLGVDDRYSIYRVLDRGDRIDLVFGAGSVCNASTCLPSRMIARIERGGKVRSVVKAATDSEVRNGIPPFEDPDAAQEVTSSDSKRQPEDDWRQRGGVWVLRLGRFGSQVREVQLTAAGPRIVLRAPVSESEMTALLAQKKQDRIDGCDALYAAVGSWETPDPEQPAQCPIVDPKDPGAFTDKLMGMLMHPLWVYIDDPFYNMTAVNAAARQACLTHHAIDRKTFGRRACRGL